jgi:hypothetical protein
MSSIKLTADSGGGTFEVKAPASSGNTRSYTLPDVAGIATLGPILEFDQWYLTTDSVNTEGDITSGLSRMNFPGSASQIGTGMTESSGIFSFPRTGKYLVICNGSLNCDGSDSVIIFTAATTNNSSYSNVALAMDGNNGSGNRTGGATSMFFLDVTDTSQVKVKFVVASLSNSSSIRGSSDPNAGAVATNFVFIRIGDT